MKCDICDADVRVQNDYSYMDHQIVCDILNRRYGRPWRRHTAEDYVFADMLKSIERSRMEERARIANGIEAAFSPKRTHRHRSGAGTCKICDLINKVRTNNLPSGVPAVQEIIQVPVEDIIPEWVTKNDLASKLWNLSRQGMDADSAWQALWRDGFKIQFGEVKELFKRFGPIKNLTNNRSINHKIKKEAIARGAYVTVYCKVGGSTRIGWPAMVLAGIPVKQFYCDFFDPHGLTSSTYIDKPSNIEFRYRDQSITSKFITINPNGWLHIDAAKQPVLQKGETLFLLIWK